MARLSALPRDWTLDVQDGPSCFVFSARPQSPRSLFPSCFSPLAASSPATDAQTPGEPRAVTQTCAGLAATILGTGRSETIYGTAGRNVIVALGGVDTIYARGGNDVICAGAGNDVIYAGPGNDVLYGQTGNDKLYGQDGRDRLSGQDGHDTLAGGPGTDWCSGEAKSSCEQPAPPPTITTTEPDACDPSYPEVCIPSPPPDLDCDEIDYRNFKVVGSDPHGFDSDGDGWGCEA